MTDARQAVESFRSSEADSRRQWRWAAISALLATLAIAALAWAVSRESTHRRFEAEQKEKLAGEISRKEAALKQVRDLALQLEAISTAAVSANDPRLLAGVQQRAQQIAQKAAVGEATARASNSSTPAASFTLPPRDVTPGVQTLTLGSSGGWDVDVFWCAGEAEQRNYAAAWSAAVVLGRAAAQRKAAGSAVSVGRVRLRPVRAQDRHAWPEGFYAVYDAGPGEQQAARTVAGFLSSNLRVNVMTLAAPGDQDRSLWYLTTFACFKD